EVAGIGSAVSTAGAAAAGPTCALAAAAGDEVSAAIAKPFGAYGQEYQAVLAQVEAVSSVRFLPGSVGRRGEQLRRCRG
ncbi:PE family protein, partial [Mycobacterium tuberculosis]|uniref:PE family protein n=1 Tax=Mycobacterium tuberculosis TaxID=1773 RepID=UPI0011546539